MIQLYTGTPGSGKSADTTKMLFKYGAHAGGVVITNFDINKNYLPLYARRAKFYAIDNDKFDPDLITELVKSAKNHKESTSLVVIDEAQLLFNSRDWNHPDRKKWVSFFTQHRKLGCDVLLVCQNAQMLDKQIRPLVEYECIHRKISSFGIVAKTLSLIFFGRLFVAVNYYAPTKMRVSSRFFLLTRKMTKIYDTFDLFGQK